MIVQINATTWNFSKDTEGTRSSEGIINFLKDNNIPHWMVEREAGRVLVSETQVHWHENDNQVVIPCETVEQLKDYCKKYDCHIEVHNLYNKIVF